MGGAGIGVIDSHNQTLCVDIEGRHSQIVLMYSIGNLSTEGAITVEVKN